MLTTVFALVFYAATAVLVVGVARKVAQYWRTPAPLKIATTPAPTTRSGVALRMAREVVLFESLFKSSKWTWLFGWTFHAALVVVLLRHVRYFTDPVAGWVTLIQPFGVYAGLAMIAGLAGLWARRFLVDRVRYISSLSDRLMLALLVAIGLSGLAMKFLQPTDIVGLKSFVLGVMAFELRPLPAHPLLVVHLGLVATLLIVFPFSKLLHAPGVFFSPTRTMVDNPREKRHLAPWAASLQNRVGRE